MENSGDFVLKKNRSISHHIKDKASKGRSNPTPKASKARSNPTPKASKARSKPTPKASKARSKPTPKASKARSNPIGLDISTIRDNHHKQLHKYRLKLMEHKIDSYFPWL